MHLCEFPRHEVDQGADARPVAHVGMKADAVGAVEPRFADLRGKVAVVTGGSRGIGAATCLASLFLLSEASAWGTGVVLDVAGGRVMV